MQSLSFIAVLSPHCPGPNVHLDRDSITQQNVVSSCLSERGSDAWLRSGYWTQRDGQTDGQIQWAADVK